MKINKYILGLLVSILAISCSDFLDENPESKYDSYGYCKDVQTVKSALNGVYKSLGNLGISGYNASKLTTDLQRSASWSGGGGLSAYSITASNSYPKELWTDHYVGVRNANYVIESIERLEAAEDDYLTYIKYKAQARGLRAYFYYNLIRTFGGVPLVTKVTTSPTDPNIKPARATMGETAQFILDDLQFAADNSVSKNDAGFLLGYFGKETALAYIAKLHLYLGSVNDRDEAEYLLSSKEHYAKAMEAAKMVIDAKAYKLTDYFPDAFSAHTKDISEEEVMLAACHNDDTYTGAGVGVVYGLGGATGVGGSSKQLTPTLYLSLFFDPTDSVRRIWSAARAEVVSLNNKTDSKCNSYDYPALLPDGKTMKDAWSSSALATFGKLRRYPVDDIPSFASGQYGMNEPILRFADVLLCYAEAYNEYHGNPGVYTPSTTLELDGSNIVSAYDAVNVVRKRARIAALGMIHDDVTPRGYLFENIDLIGMGANAYGTDDNGYYPHSSFAKETTGVVPDWRPGFYGYSYPDNNARTEDGEPRLGESYAINNYSDDYIAFHNEILNERVREFVGEANDRWFDLSRRGILGLALDKCSEFRNPLFNNYNSKEGDGGSFPTSEYAKAWMVRMPIPASEIDANENLVQNPGY